MPTQPAYLASTRIGRSGASCLLVFSLSGLTGLIYEATWTRYLQLFLGHAAYAQVLVLSLFMGGMAAGGAARLAAQWTRAWRRSSRMR